MAVGDIITFGLQMQLAPFAWVVQAGPALLYDFFPPPSQAGARPRLAPPAAELASTRIAQPFRGSRPREHKVTSSATLGRAPDMIAFAALRGALCINQFTASTRD